MTEPTPPTQTAPSPPEVHPLELQRRENRDALAALGLSPYGGRVDGLVTLAEARDRYDEPADQANQAAEAARKQARKDNPDIADTDLPPTVDDRPRVKVAGRIVLKRDGGRLIWVQLRDHTTAPAAMLTPPPSPLGGEGRGEGVGGDPPKADGEDAEHEHHALAAAVLVPDLQVAISKKDVAEPGFDAAKLMDLGDIVVVEGPLMRTNKGEITIWASSVTPAGKSLAPPPEKWSGLQDIEQRYRRRYVDLYANPASMSAAVMRTRIMAQVRRFLDGRGYLEVETPILQTQAGGAAARPFVSHMNALDIDLYMRIAPELFLKRLLVGGLPKVFEINRNFRNEGLDKQHNPEFTMLELYHAHGDVETVMELTESLVRECARFVAGLVSGWHSSPSCGSSDAAADEDEKRHSSESCATQKACLPFAGHTVDYEAPFRRVAYADLFAEHLGFATDDTDRVWAAAEQRGLTAKYLARLKGEGREVTAAEARSAIDPIILVNELFEEVAEPSLDPGKPTWIMRYPAKLSPLTRPNPDDPSVADRSDLFIGHMEIGPHYTELNDPDVQAERFRAQLSGLDDEESTFRNFDADFINALKVGMPPAGGLGLGIDRLCMLLLDQRTIRDVILFPMMRPEG